MYDVNFLIQNGVDVDKSLELFGDMETYNETIGEFLISAKEKKSKLELYKNEKDMPNYAIYVHSLKSDARYFGFTRLAELAYNQELKSKAGDISYICEHYQELIDEVNKSLDIVKKYVDPSYRTTSNQTPTVEKAELISSGEVYNTKTILVVDDSNIVRNFVKRIFNTTYNVGVAENGEEAISIINSNKDNDNIVAVLLDLNMPVVDGFAVLDFMKKNNLFLKIPVSIISGDSSKETIDRAFTYQIVDMLGKPFNENDVKRVVERTLYFKEMNQ